jgi:uncharacterized membrane protein YeiB
VNGENAALMDELGVTALDVDASPARTQRVGGLDLARSLAMAGMLLVNYKSTMLFDAAEPSWLAEWIAFIEGRAAATFVFLAGIGISLKLRKGAATGRGESIGRVRKLLLKRAVVLFVLGLGFMTLWSADILHHYALFICIGVLLAGKSDRTLLWTAGLCLLLTPVVDFFCHDAPGWEIAAIVRVNAENIIGFVCHLLISGYYPLFPWASFFIAGLWVGRRNIHTQAARYKIFITGVLLHGVAAFVSDIPYYFDFLTESGLLENYFIFENLFLMDPWYPAPLFPVSACGTALIVLWGALELDRKFGDRRWMRPLLDSGRVTLTIYLAHVVFGMELLAYFNAVEYRTMGFAVLNAVGFYVLAMLLATTWFRRFKYGPIESLIRRF